MNLKPIILDHTGVDPKQLFGDAIREAIPEAIQEAIPEAIREAVWEAIWEATWEIIHMRSARISAAVTAGMFQTAVRLFRSVLRTQLVLMEA